MLARSALWIAAASLALRAAVGLWAAHTVVPYNSILQNFSDFFGYYLPELHQVAIGHVPYRDFAYSYPPLFLYVLYPFYLITADAAAIPIVAADALTAVLVYYIVRLRSSERIAVIAAAIYILSPYFLVYEGVSWLSEQPMLFFMLLSMYLLQQGRFASSAVSYAVSALMKQDALFVLPAYLYWAYALAGPRELLKDMFAPFVAIVGVVSAPFLVLSPKQYLGSLALGRIFSGSLQPSLIPPGDLTMGSATSIASSAPVPAISCSAIGANFFAATYSCTGVNVSNYVVNNSALANTIFSILIPLLLIPIIVELGIVDKSRLFTFSFLVSGVGVTELLFFFSGIASYKYYLVPAFALLLVCATDYPTLVLGAVAPFCSLFLQYAITYRVVPLVAIQALVLIWLATRKKSATFEWQEEKGGQKATLDGVSAGLAE